MYTIMWLQLSPSLYGKHVVTNKYFLLYRNQKIVNSTTTFNLIWVDTNFFWFTPYNTGVF